MRQARLTESRNATCDAYRVANQQMAAKRALKWIGSRRPSWFLDMKYQTCCPLFVLCTDKSASIIVLFL